MAAAIALIAQTIFIMGLLKSVKTVQQHLTRLLPRAEAFLDSAEKTLVDGRKQIADISVQANSFLNRANEIVDLSHAQVVRVDTFMGDAAGRARVQMDRVELMLDDSLNRVQDTVAAVHGTILKPIREVNAVAAGFRTAFQTLVKSGRSSVAQATTDEEMFI